MSRKTGEVNLPNGCILHPDCFECPEDDCLLLDGGKNVQNREYYLKNRDKILAQNRIWTNTHKEKVQGILKKYRTKPEIIAREKAYQKAYYLRRKFANQAKP